MRLKVCFSSSVLVNYARITAGDTLTWLLWPKKTHTIQFSLSDRRTNGFLCQIWRLKVSPVHWLGVSSKIVEESAKMLEEALLSFHCSGPVCKCRLRQKNRQTNSTKRGRGKSWISDRDKSTKRVDIYALENLLICDSVHSQKSLKFPHKGRRRNLTTLQKLILLASILTFCWLWALTRNMTHLVAMLFAFFHWPRTCRSRLRKRPKSATHVEEIGNFLLSDNLITCKHFHPVIWWQILFFRHWCKWPCISLRAVLIASCHPFKLWQTLSATPTCRQPLPDPPPLAFIAILKFSNTRKIAWPKRFNFQKKY